MTTQAPLVDGSGVQVPVANYTAAISDGFPRPNRIRPVESSLAGRHKLDILPVNLSIDNTIRDSFLEFRIPAVDGHFLDLSTLAIELDLTLHTSDGASLTETDHVMFANGISNTLFKSCVCYLNEQLVESSGLYNYHSFIKMITNIGSDRMSTLGRSMFYYPDYEGSGVKEVFDEAYFTGGNKTEKEVIKKVKARGLTLMAPLFMDIATIDQFLLDNINVRIRLELANKSWILNTPLDGNTYQYRINSARLYLDRVTPYVSALEALRSSLALSPVEYTFNRSLYKTYVLAHNQTSLMAELPWAQIIPERIFMLVVDMRSFSGDYKRNGLYFQHADLSNINITVNGSTIYNVTCSFPDRFSKLYYTALESLGLDSQHSLCYDAFGKGRTVCIFNLLPEETQNSLPVERSGNLRIQAEFAKGEPENRLIILFSDTLGILEIDSQYNIRCKVRA